MLHTLVCALLILFVFIANFAHGVRTLEGRQSTILGKSFHHEADPGTAGSNNSRERDTAISMRFLGTADNELTIVHISDTHGLHKELETTFGKLPPADILIHTGDFVDGGKQADATDFNEWLATLTYQEEDGTTKSRYQKIFVITGNHEWKPKAQKKIPSAAWRDWYKQVLTNAIFLGDRQTILLKKDGKLQDAPLTDGDDKSPGLGLKMYGISWLPWQTTDDPDGYESTRDDLQVWNVSISRRRRRIAGALMDPWKDPTIHSAWGIPHNVDLLLTHCPAYGVLDIADGLPDAHFGSEVLRKVVNKRKPRAHLWGHIHEQRGHWARFDDAYVGGIEYKPGVTSSWRNGYVNWDRVRDDMRDNEYANQYEHGRPDRTCPVMFMSNGANRNNPSIDRRGRVRPGKQIVSPAKVIKATRNDDGLWYFDLIG